MATDKLVDFDHVTDYISREAALACFHDWIDRYGHEHTADEMVEYQRIEELPVADAVEVVRCKDCKWYMESKYTPPIRFCYRLKDSNGNPVGYNFAESDFCSYAERI